MEQFEQLEQQYNKEISVIRRIGQTIKWGSASLMTAGLATVGVETAVYGDTKRTVIALGTAMLSSFGLILGVGLESIADNEQSHLHAATFTPGQIEQYRVN